MLRTSGDVRSGVLRRSLAVGEQRNQEVQRAIYNDMYSDQIGVVGNRKRSVKDRLRSSGDGIGSPVIRQSVKRQRQEDAKWKHDLYDGEDEDDIGAMNGQSGQPDLRAKLTRKNAMRNSEAGSGGNGPQVRDLREKLSGPLPPPQPENNNSMRRISSSIVRASTTSAPPPVAVHRPAPVLRTNPPPPKAPPPVEELTVASLLNSLGLAKYMVKFQNEEVDMVALRHMSHDDLKELGVPMGPRTKIMLALSSSRT